MKPFPSVTVKYFAKIFAMALTVIHFPIFFKCNVHLCKERGFYPVAQSKIGIKQYFKIIFLDETLLIIIIIYFD